MDDSRIAFKGTLQQLLEKVEKGEMIPKLQASHAPPCKFWTAFQVINGIRHVAPVIHGPKGCTYSVGSAYKMTSCEYRGVPLEPTSCTAQDEADVVALLKRHPDQVERLKELIPPDVTPVFLKMADRARTERDL